MNKELILQMQNQFDALVQTHPEATDLEFWFARDLQELLGYEAEHHFRGVTKMVASRTIKTMS